MTDQICVQSFPSRAEAEAAQARLAGAGIEASVMADDAGGWQPWTAYTAGVRLMVRRPDAERATQILG